MTWESACSGTDSLHELEGKSFYKTAGLKTNNCMINGDIQNKRKEMDSRFCGNDRLGRLRLVLLIRGTEMSNIKSDSL